MSENDRRIDYVEFAGGDIAATKAFYEQAFGWKFTDYGPDYSSFEDGRLSGGLDASLKAGRGPLVVIYADDLEEALRRVERSGGRIARAIFDFPGGRRFHFTDPAGNELAVWSDKR
jgi:hypothetical protein